MPFITVTALSHPGLMRDHNEDSLAAGPWTLCGTVTENPQTLGFPLGSPLVVAVTDGMGGQPAGEVASSIVVRRLAALGPVLDSEQAVRDALDVCNQAVYAAAGRDPDLTGMGTTVAGVVVLAREVLVFNVGDSRVLDAPATHAGLRRISVDDSPPAAPGRRTTSVVTQALGGASPFSAITPHVSTEPLTTGERYLVCTDGLTDPVPEDVLDTVLRAHDGGHAAFRLWKSAIDAGGPDNITLALIDVIDNASSLSGGDADGPAPSGGRA
ncbi:protein phosphatase 2C domain-containing protein [Streptomyces sp. NPDC020403]|uniref:PP2C family protein-serine/threonine phosphatase n=1 Tax=unclassified Streptomyces TaxID=2593676 RepID=UPI0033FC1EA9